MTTHRTTERRFELGLLGILLGLTFAAVTACGSGSSDTTPAGVGGSLDAGSPEGPATGGMMGADLDSEEGLSPAETEDPSSFRAPVVSGPYLWTSNPLSGRVALIDGRSLTTRVASAGLLPTHLVAVPGPADAPRALVLNLGSSDATLLSLVGSTLQAERVRTHVGANRWAVSEDGGHAVAWTAREDDDVDPTDGLQEVTLISLDEQGPHAERLTVGYRPSQVAFGAADSHLIVVAERGISLVDVETRQAEWVELSADPERDVSITPDGSHVAVSRSDTPEIEIVPLGDPEARRIITLSGPISDLDVGSDGRAVAVVRSQSQISTFLVSEAVQSEAAVDTIVLMDETIGSVELSPDAQRAVVFTNALESEHVSVIELEPGPDFLSHRAQSVEAQVANVIIAPDGAHAISWGSGVEGQSSGSFALLSLDEPRFPRVLGSGAPVSGVALADEFGIVTAADDRGRYEAHVVSFSRLSVESFSLPSPPTLAGVLPEQSLAFVAQEHAEGRVTFFDTTSGRVRTLTGFELSAEVVE